MSTEHRAAGRAKTPLARKEPRTGGALKGAKRRILLVDDHPMTREGLAANINRQPDLEVCGEASNPAEAIAILSSIKPDLMVTDITMPGRSGIEFLKDA